MAEYPRTGLFTFHARTGTIADVTPGFSEIANYPADSLPGMNISALFPDRCAFGQFLDALLTSRSVSGFEIDMQPNNRTPVRVLINGLVMPDLKVTCSLTCPAKTRKEPPAIPTTDPHSGRSSNGSNEAAVTNECAGQILKGNQASATLPGCPEEDLSSLDGASGFSIFPDEPGSAHKFKVNTERIRRGRRILPAEISSRATIHSDRQACAATLTSDLPSPSMEQELPTGDEKFKKIGEIVPYGVWMTDSQGVFTYCSDAFLTLLKLSPDTIHDFSWIQKLPPQDRDRILSDWKQCVKTASCWDYEYRIMDDAGKEHYILSRGAPLHDGKGMVQCYIGIHLDVTEQHSATKRMEQSLREKEVILKEVHHRVKNNMAVISSFLMLQSQYIDDPATIEILHQCQQRVNTMALVHGRLYQGQSIEYIDASEYIASLVRDLLNASMLSTDIKVDFTVDHLNFGLDMAIPCGLIVNELVMNAVKHAFNGRRDGRIRIELSLLPEHRYRLVVEDNGTGLPPGFDARSTSSLGMQLVSVLVLQLGGTLSTETDGGARFTIEFPEKY